MWTKIISRKTLVSMLLSVFFLLPLFTVSADTTTAEQPQTITMQYNQYSRLNEIMNQQEMTLTTLEAKLKVLEQSSTADKQTLIQLNDTLEHCNNQLTAAKQQLTNANSSLTKAEETLKKQNESLQILTSQIKKLENKEKTLRRQRDMYGVLAGTLLIYAAVK